MNISQHYESKTLKCPTCLQNRRHVASLPQTFHKLEFIIGHACMRFAHTSRLPRREPRCN